MLHTFYNRYKEHENSKGSKCHTTCVCAIILRGAFQSRVDLRRMIMSVTSIVGTLANELSLSKLIIFQIIFLSCFI